MTDQQALHRAILTDPHDDTVRLAYADWCDENAFPERAAFIRVQIELHRLDPEGGRRFLRQPDADLLDRELELWKAHSYQWFFDAYPYCRFVQIGDDEPDEITVLSWARHGNHNGTVRRGFVDEVQLPLDAFFEHHRYVFKTHPVTRVYVSEIANRGAVGHGGAFALLANSAVNDATVPLELVRFADAVTGPAVSVATARKAASDVLVKWARIKAGLEAP